MFFIPVLLMGITPVILHITTNLFIIDPVYPTLKYHSFNNTTCSNIFQLTLLMYLHNRVQVYIILSHLDSLSTTQRCSGPRLLYRLMQIDKYKRLKRILYTYTHCIPFDRVTNHDHNHDFPLSYSDSIQFRTSVELPLPPTQ
jgi:hypothetical protein